MKLEGGQIVAGRFRLVRELGRGGMGSVWLAHHTGLDTPCAVKFIHQNVVELAQTRMRFEREAKAVAQLRSPHVVQVLDYGEWENAPYIAMEYLDGEDLSRRLKRRGERLTPVETVAILSQVARALTKAHAAGLVHRDLKPENIFLVQDEEGDLVKVLDFGIAKAAHHAPTSGSTATGALLGTPSFMSPEQAQGTKAVDHRSDLWAMAMVAFRCLTGRLPFVSEALGDLLVQIIVGEIPVPSRIAPDLPPSFDAWFTRAAARDPAMRFQSARELVETLAYSLGVPPAYVNPAQRTGSVPMAAIPHPPPTGPGAMVSSPGLPSAPGLVSSPALASSPGHMSGPGTPPAAWGISGAPVAAATPSHSNPGVASAAMAPAAGPVVTVPGVSRTYAGAGPSGGGWLLRIVVAVAMLGTGAGVAALFWHLSNRNDGDSRAATAASASATATAAPSVTAAAATSGEADATASRDGSEAAPATEPTTTNKGPFPRPKDRGTAVASPAPPPPSAKAAAPVATAKPAATGQATATATAKPYNPGF